MKTKPGPVGNIVLIGFMGAGKTEVGRRLATRTGREFVDTDTIVEAGGLSIADIFHAEGEAGFRRREQVAVARAAKATNAVIATGGGTVLLHENAKALKKSGVLVYLQVSFEELFKRIEASGGRPLLAAADTAGAGPDEQRLEQSRQRRKTKQLLKDRLPAYESVADLTFDCAELTADSVAQQIVHRLRVSSKKSKVATVEVEVGQGYRILVGEGLLRRAAGLLPIPVKAETGFIVSHPRVQRLWGQALMDGLKGAPIRLEKFAFPEGEERKNLDSAGRLYKRMAAIPLHRSDLLFALGGGVVCDVTSFVASTYARGLNYIHVPTTLLAMVDAAIGGKTGVNLPEGKNLVGTFHQPLCVLCDLDVLRTLPERELKSGLAEVMKYALIADPSLGELVLDNRTEVFARESILESIVVRSAEIKGKIVAADEREKGDRAHLNYGHTAGHALEALSMKGGLTNDRGQALSHGEAISVGMVFAAWLSVLTGLAHKDLVDEHQRLLEGVGLPVRVGRVSFDELHRNMELDKKYLKSIRFVLLSEPGKPQVYSDLPLAMLQEALHKVSEG